jgi:WD40 repeat protein
MQPNDYTFNTVGKRHVCFWNHTTQAKKKGLSNGHPMGTHLVSCWDKDGTCYSGYQDGGIYVWKDRTAEKVIKAHSKQVEAITWRDNCLYTGGADGKVCTFSTPDMAPGKCIEIGARVRAVDFLNDCMLVGTKDGQLKIMNGEQPAQTVMESHNDGEVWGLC